MDKGRYLLLKSEVVEKLKVVKLIYEKIKKKRSNFQKTQAEIDSMGYKLHNLYCAYEEVFETIANFFENQIEGSRYHADLLFRMKIEIGGIRPKLLSQESFLLLDELRRFMHFFRHAYGIDLDKEKVGGNVGVALKLENLLEDDWEKFLKSCQNLCKKEGGL